MLFLKASISITTADVTLGFKKPEWGGDYGYEILKLCSDALNRQICFEMLKALPFYRTITVMCSVTDRCKKAMQTNTKTLFII